MKRKKRKGPAANQLQYELKKCAPEDLLLDPQNPRLSLEEQGASPEKLLELMVSRFDIDELAESIIASGYVPLDPLVAFENQGNIQILEGNRRVATVKLLLNPGLAPEKYRRKWEQLSARLSDEVRTGIATLDVYVLKSRDEAAAAAYIGFRHVTGVLTWPALEKAKYIAHLVAAFGWTYEQIAERLGTSRSAVEKHYVAYEIVRQAVLTGIPGAENMEDAFGVLLRALQSEGIPQFLGVVYPNDPKKSKTPIDDQHTENLRLFTRWTFGTEDARKVLMDSRDLTRWGRILRSAEGVAYLKRTEEPDFERAWFKSGGSEESVAASLHSAADRLEESVALVGEHRANPDVLDGVRRCAKHLGQILAYFPSLRAELGVPAPNA